MKSILMCDCLYRISKSTLAFHQGWRAVRPPARCGLQTARSSHGQRAYSSFVTVTTWVYRPRHFGSKPRFGAGHAIGLGACILKVFSHVMSHVQMVPLCPSKVPIRRPSSDRHRLADRSFAQLMRRSPSRLNLHTKGVPLDCDSTQDILGKSLLRRSPNTGLVGVGPVSASCMRMQMQRLQATACALDLCQRPLMAFK